MRYLIGIFILGVAVAGLFFFWRESKIIEIKSKATVSAVSLTVPEAPLSPNSKDSPEISKISDIEPQKPLANPPREIKAVYLTSWSASSQKKIGSIINLIKSTELNAVVIDIKDYSGYVAYDIKTPEVEKYNAKEVRIPRLNAIIKQFHDERIYVIARITVFQDPQLAKARPDLAIHSVSKSTTWLDHKGLSWIDPAAEEAWDYNIQIAKDAASRGFDELNFDYIRFASDGDLADMKFPFWNGKKTKHEIIKSFFKYLREQLPNEKISADLFGLATVNKDDLGIGQVIEDAYEYFDYVAPMVYPSHYAAGFLNFKNPASHPYEVIKYSMDNALSKLNHFNLEAEATSTIDASGTISVKTPKHDKSNAKLRPWLQDFDLGADYNAEMVQKEIQAVYDTFCGVSSTPRQLDSCDSPYLDGFMLWSPTNIYTAGALKAE